jgi:hypothetical protein
MYIQLPAMLLLLATTAVTHAQRVKRKGVTPVDVSKNKIIPVKDTPVFTLEQFTGKWQETARTDRNHNSPAVIVDTVLLHFTTPGKVITRDGNHANISGAAEIEAPGNVLVAAADIYTILSVSPEQLVLDDQENYIHTFTRTETFTYENYGKSAIGADTYGSPIAISLTDVMGKWSVYRRQARPGAVAPGTAIIKYLFISSRVDDNTANGEITFSQREKSTAMSCSIKVNATSIAVVAGENRWELFVYKADGKELVFGNSETLLYYAKPL